MENRIRFTKRKRTACRERCTLSGGKNRVDGIKNYIITNAVVKTTSADAQNPEEVIPESRKLENLLF